jgi:hypothetical protein
VFGPVATGACLAGSVIVIFAAATKLIDLPGFAATLSEHLRIPPDALRNAAFIIASAEALTGAFILALTLTARRAAAALVIAAVFAGFAAYALLLAADPPPRPTSCGCGFRTAAIKPGQWSGLAVENAVIAGLFALFAAAAQRLSPSPSPAASPGPSPPG